ncbi:MAG: excinuclease ABC subunit UvrC [Betaproteobacteria bacterium]|nr:excinuclease ABC subunit UvrC [Betaproteobacteria bacterium]
MEKQQDLSAPTASFDAPALIARLPQRPGVYRMFDREGGLLYVGKAGNLKRRVSSYFQQRQLSPRIAHMVGKVAAVEFSITASETEALLLENNLIKQLKPRYNILFRDDKTYPYLRITDDRFARIAYYRGATQAKGHFFGPFPSAWAVKESLQILQKVFHLRTCEDSVFANRTRPCLEHQIGRCSGPCVGLIDEAEYREDIDRALRFLRGETTHILNELESLMLAHSEAMAFEKAAVYRNRMAALSKVLQQQSMESEGEHDIDVIAHAQHGGHASLVVASIRGGRHLGDRSFIVELPGQSEAEPLHEETQAELLERFVLGFYETARLPAVLLADFTPNESLRSWCDAKAGQSLQWLRQAQGVRRQWLQQAQHNAQAHLKQHLAQRSSARDRTQALIGLLAPHSEVKAEDFRIECFDISHSSGEATQASCVVYKQHALQQKLYRRYNIENITAGDAVLMLIAQIRDEAHRVAVSGMRAKRDKARQQSRLDEVEGIGPRRKQRLLARFGGLRGVMAASIDELAQVEGVSKRLAETLYQQLHA